MADERAAPRDFPTWKAKPASWTKIFGTFLVALDPYKLLVAAAGIFATAFGWWLISVIFYYSWTIPKESDYDSLKFADSVSEEERGVKKKEAYQKSLATWALMYELAGPTNRANKDATAKYVGYYTQAHPDQRLQNFDLVAGYGGKYRHMPWAEDRGPNPFVVSKTVVSGSGPQRKAVLEWFLFNQLPNLVEPLSKFLTPIAYLFDPRANFWVSTYLVLLIVWFLTVWAFFGGVITRMAVLQLTGKEGGGLFECLRFVKSRYLSYLISPIVPIILVFVLIACCMLFGVLHWIPMLGDFVDGIFWFLPMIAGLVMTLTLIGMVGYPMMYTTLSAEGSDTFDALSRSYNYVYESPWHYIWYSFVAMLYGAVLTLFVVTVGSMTCYLAKFGVSKFPAWGADRSPEYLFAYAPESMGWRSLLVQGSPLAENMYGEPINPDQAQAYMNNFAWYNHAGAGMVSFWTTLLFMMAIGFGYSYFWTASTQIYLLMRKRVDETDMDEVFVEDEAADPPPALTTTPSATAAPTGAVSLPVISAPTPVPVAPAPVPAAPAPAAPAPVPATPAPTPPPPSTGGEGSAPPTP